MSSRVGPPATSVTIQNWLDLPTISHPQYVNDDGYELAEPALGENSMAVPTSAGGGMDVDGEHTEDQKPIAAQDAQTDLEMLDGVPLLNLVDRCVQPSTASRRCSSSVSSSSSPFGKVGNAICSDSCPTFSPIHLSIRIISLARDHFPVRPSSTRRQNSLSLPCHIESIMDHGKAARQLLRIVQADPARSPQQTMASPTRLFDRRCAPNVLPS